MPTPATRQPQLIDSYYTPVTRSPAEIKLQPAPLSMPTPATHQLFQQPKPVTYYRSPMDQPPAETKLRPLSAHYQVSSVCGHVPAEWQTVVHQLCELESTIPSKSWAKHPQMHQSIARRPPMAQSLAKIRPQPLSAHHKVSIGERLSEPTMVSHFSVYPARVDAQNDAPSQWQAVAQQLCELQLTTSFESKERYSLNSDSQ